jgi:hypothetical protein
VGKRPKLDPPTVKTLKQKIPEVHEGQQLHQYLNQGQLNFTLYGPTLNGTWRFFQTLAQKIKRKPVGLPRYTVYIKLGKTDPAIWEASDVPAKTHTSGKNSRNFHTQKDMKSTHKGMKNHCFSRKIPFHT